MSKSSAALKAQAQKLLEQARKLEEDEAKKIGSLVIKLFQQNKITDHELKKHIAKILGEDTEENIQQN
jgi:hypothetical protein